MKKYDVIVVPIFAPNIIAIPCNKDIEEELKSICEVIIAVEEELKKIAIKIPSNKVRNSELEKIIEILEEK